MGDAVKIETALICDEVRKEDNGKLIIVGIVHGFSGCPSGAGVVELAVRFQRALNARTSAQGSALSQKFDNSWKPAPTLKFTLEIVWILRLRPAPDYKVRE